MGATDKFQGTGVWNGIKMERDSTDTNTAESKDTQASKKK
eukprot:CAMPEP_0117570772 /NCGR_PEP_ID=MMETSP0784-20121206/59379_1 /TAXON_ID=39447 /ORGANISM="" /LENGTH=39 /DNA_ID= /DNA_START= /DNA_END= /DNA_ORIENTATION=